MPESRGAYNHGLRPVSKPDTQSLSRRGCHLHGPRAPNLPAKPLADITNQSRPSEMGQGLTVLLHDSLGSLEEEDLAKRHPWFMWAKGGQELSNEGHYEGAVRTRQHNVLLITLNLMCTCISLLIA